MRIQVANRLHNWVAINCSPESDNNLFLKCIMEIQNSDGQYQTSDLGNALPVYPFECRRANHHFFIMKNLKLFFTTLKDIFNLPRNRHKPYGLVFLKLISSIFMDNLNLFLLSISRKGMQFKNNKK